MLCSFVCFLIVFFFFFFFFKRMTVVRKTHSFFLFFLFFLFFFMCLYFCFLLFLSFFCRWGWALGGLSFTIPVFFYPLFPPILRWYSSEGKLICWDLKSASRSWIVCSGVKQMMEWFGGNNE